MVVVADAGMLSTTNLTALDEAGLKFIVGSRQVKAPGDLANHFHWNGDAFEDGQLIDTSTPRHGNTKTDKTERKRRRREPVWGPKEHPGHWRAVWAFSKKRATRDGHTLTAQENRARAVIDGDAAVKSTRFVKTTAAGRTLRSEEHTSELQSRGHLVCRLLLEKKKKKATTTRRMSCTSRSMKRSSL